MSAIDNYLLFYQEFRNTNNFKNNNKALACLAQLIGALFHTLKGDRFNSQQSTCCSFRFQPPRGV